MDSGHEGNSTLLVGIVGDGLMDGNPVGPTGEQKD